MLGFHDGLREGVIRLGGWKLALDGMWVCRVWVGAGVGFNIEISGCGIGMAIKNIKN